MRSSINESDGVFIFYFISYFHFEATQKPRRITNYRACYRDLTETSYLLFAPLLHGRTPTLEKKDRYDVNKL